MHQCEDQLCVLRHRQILLEDLCRGKGQGGGNLWSAVAQARQVVLQPLTTTERMKVVDTVM